MIYLRILKMYFLFVIFQLLPVTNKILVIVSKKETEEVEQ